jgi:ATP-binding cassette, subfamily B, bacterial PglK
MLGLVRRSAHILGTGFWRRWLLLVALALLVSALEATGAVMVFLLIGLVTGSDDLSVPVVGDIAAVLPVADRGDQLLVVSAVIAVFFLVRAGIMLTQTYCQARVAHNAGARLSKRLLDGYLSMPYSFHLQRNSAELIRNAFDSTQVFVRELLIPSTRVVSEALIAVGLVIVLLVTAPVAALLALAVLVPITYVVLRVVHPRVKQLGSTRQQLAKASLQTLQQCLGAMRDIKVLGRDRTFSLEYARHQRGFARAQYLRELARAIPKQVIETSLMLFIVGFFVVTILQGGSTESMLTVLGLFAYVALRIKPPLTNILSGLNAIKFAVPAVDDLYRDVVLFGPPRTPRARREEERLPFREEIRIENVSFRYESTLEHALTGIDLRIRHGESIGIVGPTGGGKSTLADLILSLLTPTTGRVLVDGVDVAGCTDAWQANLGVVSQSVFITDDTLRRNICLGVPDDEIDPGRLEEAIRMAQLTGFVEELPEGAETFLGERGVRVSGGQRQRIAIARALYHQPSVLVFDEGTSALDTITEREVVAALESLRGRRTIITIAHRLSTIRACDRIVLLQQGRLSDTGSYNDLLRRNRDFRAMAAVG